MQRHDVASTLRGRCARLASHEDWGHSNDIALANSEDLVQPVCSYNAIRVFIFTSNESCCIDCEKSTNINGYPETPQPGSKTFLKQCQMRTKVCRNKTPHMKPQTHKEDMQQRNHLETVSGKTAGRGSSWGRRWREVKPVLFARNLTLNFDPSPKYKHHDIITNTYLYNFDPLKPHFYIVKLGFTGIDIIFLISDQKHRLWVLVRTASPRRF